jgi:hypothetical protein
MRRIAEVRGQIAEVRAFGIHGEDGSGGFYLFNLTSPR